MPVDPAPPPSKRSFWPAGFFLFFGLALLVTTAVGVWHGVSSRSWPSAPGTVTHSSISVGRKSHPSFWLTYSYRVGEKAFLGDTLHFGGEWIGDESPRAQAARLPIGKRVTVFYSPANPARSVLEPGVRVVSTAFGFAAGAGLLAFGGWILRLRR